MRSRASEQIALRFIAALAPEQGELSVGLDALGEDRDVEALAERQHRADDRLGLRVGLDLVHEQAVELDLVEGERAQRIERGVAGAEIVERDGDAERLDLTQDMQRAR